jgi:DnaJ-class molecular chaperone
MDLNKLNEENYYKLLEVDKNASDEEINRAYKNLSKIYHPDKQPDNKDKAEEIFKKLSHAKNILLDKDKKRMYDLSGSENGNPFMQGNPFQNGNPFEGVFNGNPFGNLFGNIFRGFTNQNQGSRIQRQKFKEYITLEDVYKGYSHIKKLKITNECKKCDGLGKEFSKKCESCNGNGFKMIMKRIGPNMITQTQEPCNDCSGLGKIGFGSNCIDCNGTKTIEEIVEVNVKYFPSVKDKEMNSFIHNNYEFIFEANIKEHPVFRREGDHLYIEKNITLYEALLGTKFLLKFLDDKEIVISSKENEIIKPETEYRIKGMGINKSGDLIIKFNIEFPSKLNKEQKENLKKILLNKKEDEIEKEFERLKFEHKEVYYFE